MNEQTPTSTTERDQRVLRTFFLTNQRNIFGESSKCSYKVSSSLNLAFVLTFIIIFAATLQSVFRYELLAIL